MRWRLITLFPFIAVLCCVLLFVLFPAEYVRKFSLDHPFKPVDRFALKLTELYANNGLRYGCDNPVYFGMFSHGYLIPGIDDPSFLDKASPGSEKVAYFFVPHIYSEEYWPSAYEEIEAYNSSRFPICNPSWAKLQQKDFMKPVTENTPVVPIDEGRISIFSLPLLDKRP